MPLMSTLDGVSDDSRTSFFASALRHAFNGRGYHDTLTAPGGLRVVPRTLTDANSVNEAAILALHQRHTLQVIATVCGSISILATLIAVYWFCMMRRSFRRDLILLLFVGDFFKSFWIMCFACYTFVHGPVPSASTFCQANGYLLQVSLELCDFAILLMSIHMYLQIFPWAPMGRDGLYHVRRWAYAVWFVVPNITAALAFVNPGHAYQAAGPFCTLPVRPIWYRLALSWIPRYLIWLYFMGVAVRIYFFVGREFKVFRDTQEGRSSTRPTSSSRPDAAPHSGVTTVSTPRNESFDRDQITIGNPVNHHHHKPPLFPAHLNVTFPAITHSAPGSRRSSTPDWTTTRPREFIPMTRSLPSSRRGSRQMGVEMIAEHDVPPPIPTTSNHNLGSMTTSRSSGPHVAPDPPHMPSIAEIKSAEKGRADTANDAAAQIITDRRRVMQRQLRMLFIYPVVYLIMWIFPFVNHCLNYSDRYAQNPVYAIGILNIFCQATMGFVDVCVFSLREKPWRHIPGNDNSFLGSFRFYKFCQRPSWLYHLLPDHGGRPHSMTNDTPFKNESSPDREQRFLSTASIAKRKSSSPSVGSNSVQTHTDSRIRDPPRRPAAAASIRQQLDTEHAQTRLNLERADWQKHQREQDEQRPLHPNLPVPPSPRHHPSTRREWWDTDTTNDLFRDEADPPSRSARERLA